MKKYEITVDGNCEEYVTAENAEQALSEYLDSHSFFGLGRQAGEGTTWADVSAHSRAGGDDASASVQLPERAPKCTLAFEHDFSGADVRGNGGGIISKSECQHCKWVQVTNTWAQRSDTGEQGFTTVEYTVYRDE